MCVYVLFVSAPLRFSLARSLLYCLLTQVGVLSTGVVRV